MTVRNISQVAALLALSACGTVDVPQVHLYRLRPATVTAGFEHPSGTLGIGQITISSDLLGDQLVVRHGQVRQSTFEYHQWAAPLDRLIAEALEVGLSRTGCFDDVLLDAGTHDVDYVLDAHVRGFHGAVRAGGWVGEATIVFRLTDSAGQTVLCTELTASRTVDRQDAESVAVALSFAIEGLIGQFLGGCETAGLFERNPVATPGG